MIEKVAQAIIDVRIARDLQGLPQSLEQEVRAAIAAMREPTEVMLEAGFKKKSYTKETWQAMIDAALKDKP